MNPQTSQEASELYPYLQDALEVGQAKNPPSNYPVESIYGVGRRYSESLRKIGIETVGDIARITNIDKFEETLGIPAAVLHKIRLRAISYITGKILQTESVEFPGDSLIYFDIETDDRCNRVWLIGLLVDGRFTQFYADKWDDEKHILEKFLGFLETHRGYILVSYSGTCFDYRVILNAIKRHELSPIALDEFTHVDLCTLLRRSFIFPQSSYALKELGNYLSYGFKQNDLDGLQVSMAYQRHLERGIPLDARFFDYNEDDVRVIQHLIERCFRLKSRSKNFHIPHLDYPTDWVFIKTKLDPWLDSSLTP